MRLDVIKHPRTRDVLRRDTQARLLEWQLPSPFTLRELSAQLGAILPEVKTQKVGELAQHAIQQWLSRGLIMREEQLRDGLPSYRPFRQSSGR